MSGDQKEPVLLRFVCRLRGGSQPILAEASDGLRYVVKFANQPQGPNLLFNESIGTELYRRAHLTVPAWRPLRITESFVCQNQSCWLETPDGFEPPQTGLCFGSCHLGSNHIRLYELLSGRGYLRVRNRNDFWIAWLLDVCAFHADNRQAVFCQGLDGKYCGAFIDQGHMFGGPKGEKDMSFAAPAYLDRRIYPSINFEPMEKYSRSITTGFGARHRNSRKNGRRTRRSLDCPIP